MPPRSQHLCGAGRGVEEEGERRIGGGKVSDGHTGNGNQHMNDKCLVAAPLPIEATVRFAIEIQ